MKDMRGSHNMGKRSRERMTGMTEDERIAAAKGAVSVIQLKAKRAVENIKRRNELYWEEKGFIVRPRHNNSKALDSS